MEEIKMSPNFFTLKDPIEIGYFDYKDAGNRGFDIPEVVPQSATWVQITALFRSGNELDTHVHTKLWTVNQDGVNYYNHHFAHRYPQNAINSDSPQYIFPIWRGCREIKIQSPNVQLENCHGMRLYVTGWKSGENFQP